MICSALAFMAAVIKNETASGPRLSVRPPGNTSVARIPTRDSWRGSPGQPSRAGSRQKVSAVGEAIRAGPELCGRFRISPRRSHPAGSQLIGQQESGDVSGTKGGVDALFRRGGVCVKSIGIGTARPPSVCPPRACLGSPAPGTNRLKGIAGRGRDGTDQRGGGEAMSQSDTKSKGSP